VITATTLKTNSEYIPEVRDVYRHFQLIMVVVMVVNGEDT
jgi:hypothetical protein